MSYREHRTESRPHFRSMEIRAKVDEDQRTVELTLSSEEPVERYYDAGQGFERGLEVLSHKKRHVDLGLRLSQDETPISAPRARRHRP